MVVVYENNASEISIIPRYFISDTNLLSFFLTSESTNERTEVSLPVMSYTKGILTLDGTGVSSSTKTGQTFKLEAFFGLEIVYLGRLINVDFGTDIQNYSKASQSNSIFS